jgi:hypothetical protein
VFNDDGNQDAETVKRRTIGDDNLAANPLICLAVGEIPGRRRKRGDDTENGRNRGELDRCPFCRYCRTLLSVSGNM